MNPSSDRGDTDHATGQPSANEDGHASAIEDAGIELGTDGGAAPCALQVRRHAEERSTAVFETIETAAAKLSLDVGALRARCRRAARNEGDAIVASLGGGIIAFKFGRSWRVRFPAP